MSTNKSYKDSSDSEFNHYHKAIIVTFYIEHIMLVPNIVRCREIFFDFR